MPFVLDVSVTMTWCFEDEATGETEALLDRLAHDEATAPAIWSFEVANVLLVAERRQRLTASQASRFLDLLTDLPIRVEPRPTRPDDLVLAGRRHGLTAYDAAYLDLAARRGLSLATTDAALAAAARAAGVELLAGH